MIAVPLLQRWGFHGHAKAVHVVQPPWPYIGIDDMPGNDTMKCIPLTVLLLFSNYPVWKSSRTAMARPWIAVNALGIAVNALGIPRARQGGTRRAAPLAMHRHRRHARE